MSNSISAMKLIQVLSKTSGRCAYCGIVLNDSNYSIDHIIPKSATVHANNDVSNLLPCCRSCNSSKKNNSLERFRYKVSCRAANVPIFTEEQVAFLKKIGVFDKCLPEIKKFYYETLNNKEAEK